MGSNMHRGVTLGAIAHCAYPIRCFHLLTGMCKSTVWVRIRVKVRISVRNTMRVFAVEFELHSCWE